MPSIIKRLGGTDVVTAANEVLSQGGILGTIILPRNLNVLSSRLPKPNYRPPQQLKKIASMPGELIEEKARKVSSSQQSRGLQNVRSGILSPTEGTVPATAIHASIPVSSPSSQDVQMQRNLKNLNNDHKPIIKQYRPENRDKPSHVPSLKNLYRNSLV